MIFFICLQIILKQDTGTITLVVQDTIARLDNFPYSDLTELDHNLKDRLRRYRGVPIGEASGLEHMAIMLRLAKS
jgi:hypothetical protein